MAKTKFDLGSTLAEALGGVPKSDTEGMEQIVGIDIANIDGDADNFYSMAGIDELAANIELIGLQQPLRVRENPDMPGRYLIVSGHRRRAALWQLFEENPDKWRRVPCIVEQAAELPEMQELRLIFANANTRTMSSADLAAQAERVEMLLYKLKDQGMEFPGRMRDHVAEACRISRTKLATLKAIKNNLIPELFAYYEKNEINESCAYELQKLPAEAQTAIANSCKRTGAAFIKGWGCERCVELADKYMAERKCENGDVCDHHGTRFVKTLRTNYVWAYCPGGCCVTCRALKDCDHACKKGKAVKAEKKTEEKAEKEKEKEKAEKEQKKEFQRKCKIRQSQAQRVLPLIEAAGLRDDDELEGNYYYYREKVGEIRKAAAGDFGDRKYYYGDDHLILPKNVEALSHWADKLGCSLDYLAGRTDEPQLPAAPAPPLEGHTVPQWSTGTPQDWGRYLCLVEFGTPDSRLHEQRCDWSGEEWRAYGRKLDDVFTVKAWYRLPPETIWHIERDDSEEAAK